jgi:hypothetical protein
MKSMLGAVVLAVSCVFASVTANAVILEVDLPTVVNSDYVDPTDYNLSAYDEIQFEGRATGTGSVSISTYVDPFNSTGIGNANLLVGAGGGATSVTGTWGSTVLVFALVGSSWVADVSTIFTTEGLAGAKILKINFVGATNDQISISLSAVPIPGAALLLLSGLGGLGLLSRRRKPVTA